MVMFVASLPVELRNRLHCKAKSKRISDKWRKVVVTANRWQILALLSFQRLLENVTKIGRVPIESTEDEVCRAVCSDKKK